MKTIPYIIILILLVAVILLNQNRIDNEEKIIGLGIQKEMSIHELRFDLTGNYYFQDSIFGIGLQVSDSTFSKKLIIPVNMNEKISYQPEYSDQVVTRKLKEVICKK